MKNHSLYCNYVLCSIRIYGLCIFVKDFDNEIKNFFVEINNEIFFNDASKFVF